ncbi:MAG: dockerin type I domain-containing protein [Gammaproteobacteria bacterium]
MSQATIRTAILSIVLLSGTPSAGEAALAVVDVTGTVTSVSSDDGHLPPELSATVTGDAFSVRYIFEDAEGSTSSAPTTVRYFNAIYRMSVTIGGQTFDIPATTAGNPDDLDHTVFNDHPQSTNFLDQLTYNRVGCNGSGPCYQGVLILRELAATAPSVLSSTDRVPAPFSFASFTTRDFRFYAAAIAGQLGSSSVDDRIFGVIEGVVVAPDSDADGLPDPLDNCTLSPNASQLDADGDGYGNICDADLNNSGQVTAADFAILRSVIGQGAGANATAAKADLNGSGGVTAADYAILRARIGTAPGPSGLHP